MENKKRAVISVTEETWKLISMERIERGFKKMEDVLIDWKNNKKEN